FGAFEREALAASWAEAEHLATARIDYLVDATGQPRALEVNATIPAMQGYSDIVADAFLREVGSLGRVDAARAGALLDESGRNADQLRASLLAHYQRLLGRSPERPPNIAIVAREGDSQIGELRYLARRWTELGSPTAIATP